MPSKPATGPSPNKRLILKAVLATLAIVVLVYGSAVVYLSSRTVIVATDPLAALRETFPKAPPPDQAAWPKIREALTSLGLGAEPTNTAIADALGAGPGDEAWPTITAWIDSKSSTIAGLRAATKRQSLGFPVATTLTGADVSYFGAIAGPVDDSTWSDRERFPLLDLAQPYLGSLRTTARILATDLLRAAELQDGARATDDAEALMALANHAVEARTLLADFAAISIRARAVRTVMRVIESTPDAFTNEQLSRIQAALRSVPAKLERIDLTAERLLFQDLVQRMYSDDGNGDGWFVPTWNQRKAISVIESGSREMRPKVSLLAMAAFSAPLRPIGSPLVAGRRETLAHHAATLDRIEAAQGTDIKTALMQSRAIESDLIATLDDSGHATAWLLESLLVFPLSRNLVNITLDRAMRDAACIAIAAERFRRSTGAWPASAADLERFAGGASTLDPWSSGPVRMSTTGAGFRIWSVGSDGNDDGGDPLPNAGAAAATTPRADLGGVDWVWFAPARSDRWRE